MLPTKGGRVLALRKMCCETAQKRRLFCDPLGWDCVALLPDDIQHLDDVVEMALRVDAARESKAN